MQPIIPSAYSNTPPDTTNQSRHLPRRRAIRLCAASHGLISLRSYPSILYNTVLSQEGCISVASVASLDPS